MRPDKRTTWLVFALFLAVVFAYSVNQLSESDSFYHLKVGQIITETRSIPHADIFSYTALGAPWVPHEWLSEAVFYGVYSLGGFWLLILFVAGLSALTYALLFRLALKRGADPYLGALFIFGFSYLTWELWIPRPQVFSYLFLVLLLTLMESYRENGNKRNLILAVFLIWLWANMHASFILGLAVLAGYFGAGLLGRFARSLDIPARLRSPWLLLAFLGALGVSLINPSGYKIFLYSNYISSTVSTLHVSEWESILAFTQLFQTKVFLASLALADIFLIWRLWFRKESRDVIWLVLTLGMSVLPFVSIRHVGYWPLVAVVPVSIALSGFLENFRERYSRLAMGAVGGIFVILLAGKIFLFPRSPVDSGRVPVEAADFIERNKIAGPIFNLYNEGGYLIWRFGPENKVSIDGRSEVYKGDSLTDHFTIAIGAEGWEEVAEKYKINYFFIAYRINPIIQNLMRELTFRGWPLVYWDDQIAIYVRNDSRNREFVRKYGLYHISPIRDPKMIPEEEAALAGEEFKRELDLHPDSEVLLDYAKKFLASHPQTASPKP